MRAEGMVAGVVLAGGLSRRMGGGDKPLLDLGGVPLVAHVLTRLAPQADPLLISANGDPTRFARFGQEVRADCCGDHAGPLAGILTALDWAAERGARWLLSAAADTPLLPLDLDRRLSAARAAQGARLAMAASGGRLHPVCALWPVDLRDELRRLLVDEGERRLGAVVARFATAQVEWPTQPIDPFFNVNTPADLERLATLLP